MFDDETQAPASVGATIRSLRIRAGLTQEELAKLAGLSIRAIRNIESGRIEQPRRRTVQLLVNVLARTPADHAIAAALLPAAATTEPDLRLLATPAQLPPADTGFIGRIEPLQTLHDLANRPGPIVVTGPVGVGKSALVVHWAWKSAARYTDGHLYLDLRDPLTGGPRSAPHGLRALLRALGVPDDAVPVDQHEAAALYRSLVARRHLLILLDNAHHAHQVRPFLVGGGSLVVATGPDRLAVLTATDSARRLRLGALPGDEAANLLRRLVGNGRSQAELRHVGAIVEQCGNVPLAVRAVAALLAEQPHLTLPALAADPRGVSAAMLTTTDPDLPVHAALTASAWHLSPPARRLFALLSDAVPMELPLPAVVTLAGDVPQSTERLLIELAGASLVEYREGRWSIPHALLRAHAHRCAGDLTAEEHRLAQFRLLTWYRTTVDAAVMLLHPTAVRLPGPSARSGANAVVPDRAAALAWLDAEFVNLVDVVDRAATQGPRTVAWQIVDALREHMRHQPFRPGWLRMTRAAVAAAGSGGARARAASHYSLATAYQAAGRHRPAVEHYTSAFALAVRSQWDDASVAILQQRNQLSVSQHLERLRVKAPVSQGYLDWDAAHVHEYVHRNYTGRIHEEDALVIDEVVAALTRHRIATGSLRRVAEVGGGLNLYPSLLAAPFVMPHRSGGRLEIVDSIDSSRRYARTALTDQAAGQPWQRFAALLAAKGPQWSATLDATREVAEIVDGNLFELAANSYDMVSSYFVGEGLAGDYRTFEQAVERLVDAVRPGGFFVATHMLGSELSRLLDRTLPTTPIGLADLHAVYDARLDANIVQIDAPPLLRKGYLGMAVVTGIKR